ncbi:MAG: hypothetical protein JWQ14_27 [Adhaeribacter sp.]|nr:hypothetical protein [Adhaeribacter sp.]
MKQILKVEAWQIFLLIIVPPILMSTISESLGSFTFIIIFFGWIYLLGKSLHEKNERKDVMKFWRFKRNLILTCCLFLFTNVVPDEFFDFNFEENEALSYGIGGILIVFIITAFVSWIKLYIIISNNIDEMENKKTGVFWQLIVFPFGIWFLQPVIKGIFSQDEELKITA